MYYILKSVWEPEIKGVKSGLSQVELDEKNPITDKLSDFFLSSNYWREQKYVPDFEVENCTASLLKGAKLTDFLDFRPYLLTCPFMINDHVANVFNKFNVQKYYLYPITLYNKRERVNAKYYIFCCPFLGYEYINFKKSVFYTGNDLLGKEYYSFSDENEYRKVSLANIEKLVLNSNFDNSLDFFVVRSGGMHVSEALRDAIEILELTGVKVSDREPYIITAS